ncbi:MAG: GNAT family N-acetyltransferase [Bacteroidia bacterium]|jgi:GNAT superfamily N-acetyltransferase|nr:GNAT family N-acetyltransferase [Bacteroidia bacterium]
MIEIVEILDDEINDVVKIHLKAFPGFFLTKLGNEVLEVFYKSLLKSKGTIFYGVKNEGELVGFLVASLEPKGLYTKLFFKNIVRFALPLFFSFLKNLNFLKRMIISVMSSNKVSISQSYPTSLLSICVSPSNAGKGVGKFLLNRLEKELILQNQSGYYLTTDAENNIATNRFYLSCGFKLYDTYSQGSRRMNLYVKELK